MKTWLRVGLTIIISISFITLFYLYVSHKNCSSGKARYACKIKPKKKQYISYEGGSVEIHFRIKNSGSAPWISEGKNPCLLSYHLLDEGGEVIQYDNRRFPLPQKIDSGKTIEMTINIISPLERGEYILEFDLLIEGIAWFKDYGSEPSRITLSVQEIKWPEDEYALTLDYGKYTKFRSSIDQLNKIQKLVRVTLNKNEVGFEGRTGKVRGFSGGKDYPQIWLRDANTIIPASKYYYGESYLSSWIEEHLAFQKEDGSLEDWIDSQGSSNKNTTETDQESSAVQSAFQVFELIGSNWLETSVGGEAIIQRLERALDFVLKTRLDEERNLLIGAHTIDWGDVDIVDPDYKAIDTDENTHWTVDIYDQSMFYEAGLNLARMFEDLGEEKKSLYWKEQAKNIRDNTDKWLWQKEKGFYRVHLHLGLLDHAFDEDDLFAMGGNAQALISGLAGLEKPKKIIMEAARRQKSFGLSTISGTLLPPYPQYLFKHPMVDDPYEYQNGGQWDWFGGRLVFAMFELGFSQVAKEKLIEILDKNLKNKSFFEWDTKDGVGQGSGFFSGGAGSLSRAIFEGYFGVKATKETLCLEPKIGRDSATIHVYIPAMDIFVAYDYKFDEKSNRVALEYNSNFAKKGRIKILNPWLDSGQTKKTQKKDFSVLRDGKKVEFWLERVSEDEYIVLESDFNKHRLEIEKKR